MKKNIIFIGASICLLVLLGVGLSYSMWNMSISQENNNVIATTNDCFDIAVTSQENSIKLENAYPISDTKGKTLTPFTFTIKNTCDMAASYTVSLESLKGSTLSSSFLKVMVNDNDPKILNTLDSTDTVNSGSIESRVLDTGTIFKNKTKEYSIRLWIDYDTTMEDLNNETKVLKSRIIIKGVPSDEEEPLELLTDHITALSTTDTTNITTDDPDNNIRYIGANPDNYIYFNCDDYSNQTADTCEKWRVIGVFNNVTKGDGTQENLVKIIRNDSIGSFRWDYKKSGVGTSTSTVGSNDWTDSQLMMMLNPVKYLKDGYVNSNDKISSNGQQLYGKMGSYYNGTTGCIPSMISIDDFFSCSDVDFTSTGLKKDATRNAIEEVKWNLGGNSGYKIIMDDVYTNERLNTAYNNRATEWTGKIGLIYPSDYGYATSGSQSTDRNTCLTSYIETWSTNSLSDCANNNYLHYSSSYWTITPYISDSERVLNISSSGKISTDETLVFDVYTILPSLYLKSSFTIKAGDGSENSPYQLNIE